ncbi:lactoylglutathione lyase [Virgisporangium aliadipatigenens]|uniref:Lactoylglutathione lyase n=1 Tax=Virgisporangium aliadipatigenens TaxID=741659 RepID=A0A8J3YNG9_9ACTN|nr:VOC family protein [Virgisporangium aliadipatigenens]GIJ47090.1 lactoylglutathione lyase [Virgisporangium aliadipatigenens]
MGSRWFGLVVDSHDPARLARWWAEVLDYRIISEAPEQVAIGRDTETFPGMVFVPAPRDRAVGGRIHLDLGAEDQTAEVERLVDMGARHLDVSMPVEPDRVLLADPEGNEFRVIRTRSSGG